MKQLRVSNPFPTVTVDDAYRPLYIGEYDGKLSRKAFREACTRFNILAMEEVIKGYVLFMGMSLSSLYIGRVERGKPRVNWLESNKRKQELLTNGISVRTKDSPEGEPYFIYYTDEEYVRFIWHKKRAILRFKAFYSFTATRGPKGNKKKLIDAMAANSIHFRYFKRIRRA